MKKIKLSIIVCAYNEENSIKKCIEKLINQVIDYNNIEIIIIDNESKDQTYHIASECIKNSLFKNITLFSIEHCPLTGSRNFGLKVARGDYVAYIDADGYIMDKWFSRLITNIEIDFDVFLGSVSINPSSSFFSKSIFYGHFLPSLESRSRENKIIGANMAFKRSKLLSVNGFHTVSTDRGDETLIFSLLKEKFKSLKIIYDKSCKVINSYPERASMWFSQQFQEGKSDRNAEHLKKFNYKKTFKLVLKSTSIVLPIVLLVDLFLNVNLGIFVNLLLLLFIVRHLVRWKYYFYSILNGFKNIGIRYLFFLPIIILGSLSLDFGYLFGSSNRLIKNYGISPSGKLLKKYSKNI
tara:strand:- start:1019 stop:2074 length:1056 start_codon:yes stop_codon:yes gene_type:complete